MCKVLKINRSLVYYTPTEKSCDSKLENEIISIFKKSRNNYGTRKIKKELDKKKYQVSRKRIGRIMKKYGLVSNYTVKQYKVHKTKHNEEKIDNIVNREFGQATPFWTKLLRTRYYFRFSFYPANFRVLNFLYSIGVR